MEPIHYGHPTRRLSGPSWTGPEPFPSSTQPRSVRSWQMAFETLRRLLEDLPNGALALRIASK
eukprot:2273371-Amphidinium_carterae.1